jgi:hypothetical protein
MVERIVLASIVVAAVTARADAQPAPAPQVEPPAAEAIPLAPPSMVAPREPATSPPAASSQWYGWQILLSDAAVFSFAGLTHNAGIAYGWVGGGAIVHLGHGNVGRGLASAALRAGLPIIGLALGAASASGCTGDWCGLGEVVVGGAIGMVSAELIDVALLAHDSAPPSATVSAAQHSHGVEVSPVVRAGRSGVGLDLVGRF